ncbi:MAG: type II toxin-antitoxin system RelB/DinJ family antitoxin [Atopobiaceae bacterium]|jgi:addiction module RelB/DinJ family antitoxin|nr:type II toxin-antitoxin system RelB/DinJ family antitoxin [Atopobiaceae bacterium]
MSITTIRVDSDVKEDAREVFKKLGLSFNSGVDIYLRAVIRGQAIPFDLTLPEAEAVPSTAAVAKRTPTPRSIAAEG